MEKVVHTAPFVLIERYRFDGTEVLSTWDRQPLTRETGWEVLERSRRQHPERYGPDGEYRLVLLGAERGAGR